MQTAPNVAREAFAALDRAARAYADACVAYEQRLAAGEDRPLTMGMLDCHDVLMRAAREVAAL